SRTYITLLNDTIHGLIIANEDVHDKTVAAARQVYDQQVVGFNELGAEVSHDRCYGALTVHDSTEMWLGIVLFATDKHTNLHK
ncbi:hypothetical protein K439DRAFT_1631073, partial [Ramaria rubella]